MDFTHELRNWAQGVITSMEPDELPDAASPYGRNSAFYSVGEGKAVLGKRQGLSTMNRTAITGSPAVIGQHEYKKRNGLGFTRTHLLVTNTGRLDSMDSVGTLTTVSASAFTSGDYFPDFATAKDLEFIVNGQDRKKYNGTVVSNFGLTRPSAPSLALGVLGVPNGDYEIALSYTNSSTVHESSRSDATSITATLDAITVTLPTVGLDTQIDFIRVHIRKIGLQSNFFRVTSGVGYSAVGGGWAVGTASMSINLSDADLNNLITVSPTTTANEPPPAGVDKIAWHGDRMFVADQANVYWSEENKPESFRHSVNYEPITTDEGISITSLHAAHGVLMVFATEGLYTLTGTDPVSWRWDLIFPDLGAVSKRTVKTVNGKTFWWAEDHGPMMWNGSGIPVEIGTDYISASIASDFINIAELAQACTGVDTDAKRVVFAVPETGQTRNTILFPFNYAIDRWESVKWDPMDISSFGQAQDSLTGKNHLFFGNYAGQVFRFGTADADGITEGDHSGTFIATATSQSVFTTCLTLAGVACAFDTTGAGLIERKVTIESSGGERIARYRLSANTATTFTTATAVAGLVIGATYTFYIGGPDFRLDSKWVDGGDPFLEKRADYGFIHIRTTGGVLVDVNIQYSFDYASQSAVSATVAGDDTSAWDTMLWDAAVWDGTLGYLTKRLRVGKKMKTWKATIINMLPNQPLYVLKLGMTGRLLNKRY